MVLRIRWALLEATTARSIYLGASVGGDRHCSITDVLDMCRVPPRKNRQIQYSLEGQVQVRY